MRVTMRETVPTTLDNTGAGMAAIGPLSAREVWYPENVHVSTTFPTGQTGPTNESTCRIYAGQDTSPNYFRDETPLGSTGDATGACSADKVKAGQKIFAVWAGGDPGVQAVLTVTGSKDV